MPLFSVYLYSVFAVVAFLRCIIAMASPLHISCGLWPFPQDKPVSNQGFRPALCYLKFAPAWLLHTSNPCLISPPGDQYAIAFAGPRAARPGERQAPPRPPGRSAGGAAAFWGRGQRPRPQNMPAAGQARQRAGGRSPPAAPASAPKALSCPTLARVCRPYGGCPGAQKGWSGHANCGGV